MEQAEGEAKPPVVKRRVYTVGQSVRAFPEWTSTHGIPHMGRTKPYCVGFWTIITLIALGLLIWQLVLIVIDYYQHDVNVQVQLQFEQRTFPAVTLCDLNPYKKSIALQNSNISQLMDTYLYAMQSMSCASYSTCTWISNSTMDSLMDYYGFTGLNDTSALQTKAKRVLDLEAADFNLTSAKTQYDDFLQGCSFNTADCADSDWTLFEDPSMGNCFTFNNAGEMNATRAGPIYGLRVIAKTNVSEYLLTSDTAGMSILIHDQDEFPFPDIFGYTIQIGTATSIGVTYTEISRLGSPYGECTDTKPSDYLYDLQYSTEGCQRSTYQADMVKNCGCYDPAYPQPNGTSTMCTISSDYSCWNTQSNDTISDSSCTQPCHEGSYEVTVSAAKWPSASLTMIGECQEGQYPNQTCLEMYSQNGALIEVYYEKLNYETMAESAAYTFSTLLSNFGGQIGLWLGMSVISVVEFLVLGFQICASCMSTKAGEVVGF
ncbi:unnamed protein product [Bursaphelenchus okinawaensis]|uniref:Uncharacterized protein n=1 Tax=Bursaphelenchus okinawaensis TaxID=465554 RepID=A0A811LIV6_9BILA|nr:unnamed protein product [Bursaphelenchus okinawaensis]CAG9124070.1 unnamed protein product [Bursaphelenchus okinawaensis]